jgi:hypothetical protein
MLAGVRDHRLRCAVCGDVIGFYEPVVVLDDSGLRETSLLNEPMLDGDQVAMHHECAPIADSAVPERCNPAARVAPLAPPGAKARMHPALETRRDANAGVNTAGEVGVARRHERER